MRSEELTLDGNAHGFAAQAGNGSPFSFKAAAGRSTP